MYVGDWYDYCIFFLCFDSVFPFKQVLELVSRVNLVRFVTNLFQNKIEFLLIMEFCRLVIFLLYILSQLIFDNG